ncbi:Uncharacterized protein TCM_018428 [Theobroma cacao]|uniref:Uncharacterized protein n=1 Tax=Theobroma cacao TaxID=3641 RepID=A0A061EEP3_THECC|nr:Uncharacterized protein TCM_018428 [Theobroma cacao]
MMLNLLIRIDGKLTDQAEKMVKIEENLQQFEALLNPTKETKVPKALVSATSQSSVRTATKQFESVTSSHDRETKKEILENPNVTHAGIEESGKNNVEQKEQEKEKQPPTEEHEEEKEKEHTTEENEKEKEKEKKKEPKVGKEHSNAEKSVVSSPTEFEEILVSNFIRDIINETKVDQAHQQARMHQEAQSAPPEIEQTVEKAHLNRGKATDTDLVAKKTIGKGKKTMAIKTRTFKRKKSTRLAMTSTQ